MSELLDLWDYRRRMAEVYRRVRESPPGQEAWKRWREERDELFRSHPQSALPTERRSSFAGLPFFAYDPAWRVETRMETVESDEAELANSTTGTTRFVRFARARFEVAGASQVLDLFWLDSYAGGVFFAFRDLTTGSETYGGGRYLLDTAKGADLGHDGGRVVLDFNYAYHPSCVYDPRWSCPLPPPGNRLPVAVRAGERLGP